jgi:hypothetical protein
MTVKRHFYQKKKVNSKREIIFDFHLLNTITVWAIFSFVIHPTSNNSTCWRKASPSLQGLELSCFPGSAPWEGPPRCCSWVWGFDVSHHPGSRSTEKSASTNTAWPPAFVQLPWAVSASPLEHSCSSLQWCAWHSLSHAQCLGPSKFPKDVTHSHPEPLYMLPFKNSPHAA